MIVVQGPNMSGKLTDFDDLSLSLTANPSALRISFSVDRLNIIAMFSELSRVDKCNNSKDHNPFYKADDPSVNSIFTKCQNSGSKQPSYYYRRMLTVYIVNHDKHYLLSPARCAFINEYIFDKQENLTRQNSLLVDPAFWGNSLFDMADSVSMAIRDIILSVLILAELSMNEVLADEHDVSVFDDYDLWEDDVDIYEIIERMRQEEEENTESVSDLADIIGRVWSGDEPFSKVSDDGEVSDNDLDQNNQLICSDDYSHDFRYYYFESIDENEFQKLEISDMKEFWEIISESRDQNHQVKSNTTDRYDEKSKNQAQENQSDLEIKQQTDSRKTKGQDYKNKSAQHDDSDDHSNDCH